MSLVPFTRFVNDAAGLEKTLRGLQGAVQLVASFLVAADGLGEYVAVCETIRKHFALGRRYFRFFKFIDCVVASADTLEGDDDGGLGGLLMAIQAARWQFLGLYILTEAFTILDAMGLRKSPWAPMIFVESMRFWFYSICCSIVLLVVDLYGNRGRIIDLQKNLAVKEASARNGADTQPGKPKKAKPSEEVDEKQSPRSEDSKALIAALNALLKSKQHQQLLTWRLVGACCDLLTPGSVIGAIHVGPAVVAATSILSSAIGGREIWKKVNGKS